MYLLTRRYQRIILHVVQLTVSEVALTFARRKIVEEVDSIWEHYSLEKNLKSDTISSNRVRWLNEVPLPMLLSC